MCGKLKVVQCGWIRRKEKLEKVGPETKQRDRLMEIAIDLYSLVFSIPF